jgi:hypothetical protein
MNNRSDGPGLIGALLLALAIPAAAQSPPLAPALAPIGFLIGNWTGDDGKVAETGGASRGTSVITREVGGAVLIRRDHTELMDAQGKPTGGFDQIMMIYPEGGTLHADYSDGQHIIHYTEAKIVPGRSVVFTSSSAPGAPRFRLGYEVKGPEVVAIDFAMAPPSQDSFQPIAVGHMHRVEAFNGH